MNDSKILTEDRFSLIKKGPLGTCWYGKYHYIEPWIGCEHNCVYCYARQRGEVVEKMKEMGVQFEKPRLLFERGKLLNEIADGIEKHQVKIVKLSRYTDFFSPEFVKNGLSAEILETLGKSSAERLIITTKGVPDANCIKMMEKYKDKISYNAAIKPDTKLVLEPGTRKAETRIEAAAKIAALNIKTTVHMDPLTIGVDELSDMEPFFIKLKKNGLTRLMFSFLLLNQNFIDYMNLKLGKEATLEILKNFDVENDKKFLPKLDERFISTNETIKKDYAGKIGDMLQKHGFDFVICSLKSTRGGPEFKVPNCPSCDGTFYA